MQAVEPTPTPPETLTPIPTFPPPGAGGSRELLTLALPLIVSQSFMTVQVFVDTILLAWHDPHEMAASFPAVMWFWLPFGLLQVTAGYTSTFVAQYTGAGRPNRVGPAVWQGIHFAVLAGLLFLVVVPAAPFLIALGGHSAALQEQETIYLQCLAFAALPMLVMGAVNGFFSGRGQTWTVLGIEAFGTAVNVLLALASSSAGRGFRKWASPGPVGLPSPDRGCPHYSVWGCCCCRATGRNSPLPQAGGTSGNCSPGCCAYGGPAGTQVFLDVLVFHLFTQMVGQLGDAAMGATTLTVRLNMIAFLPMLGLGQAVCVLVGQRLGAARPDLAERTAYTGLQWAFGYMAVVATIYLTLPTVLVSLFESDRDPENFAAVAAIVPGLLACVAIFSLADSVNLTFAFALRGAGDTWFVTLLTFALAWPIMVVPTAIVVALGASVYWAWVFATAHICAMAICFFFRFRSGQWKGMRVYRGRHGDGRRTTGRNRSTGGQQFTC